MRGTMIANHLIMTDRQARRHALSEWLMEISALWIVFPLLDQLVENRPFSPWITAWSLGIALFALTGGILLRKGVSE
jgi:lipopolysaccharide export LptBFGC system permease protein LptF